tara:strand:+ start:297 stop:476 length:180 start_codon:yes stop_codon:yes gene_type:complete
MSNRAINKLKNILSSVVEAEAGGMLSQDASWNKGYVSGIRHCIYMLETNGRRNKNVRKK